MTWATPIMRCPSCSHVGRPTLTPGASKYTLVAACSVCKVIIKSLPKLGALPPEKSR